MKWTARQIGNHLARVTFDRKHLVIVPTCSWPGSECDILVVTTNLRVIDVEIKISRGDLKADVAKEKWFHAWDWRTDGPYDRAKRKPRQWPRNVWKHYYAMPAEIWKPELLGCISPMSGVLLMNANKYDGSLYVTCERMAKPCRDAGRITPEDAIDIARLASLRMWGAYAEVESMKKPTVAA